MIKHNINLGKRSYPIYITTDYTGLGKCLANSGLSGKMVLITDSNVDRHQASECMKAIKSADVEVIKYVFEAGEASKNLDTVNDIYRFLINNKLDRDSALIALGGGVAGDIAGFAAATFLRGINYIQVPTSTLAQADSSVGGKVGVDFEGKKNIVGAFYQPNFVYLNINTLKTLPKREFISGLAEVVKHGIICDADFFDYIDYNTDRIMELDEDVLLYMARVNCSIKGKVVEQDEREEGLRAILNFGHTIGHAIESASNFRLLHGECVSIGMVGAFRMALHLGMTDEDAVEKVMALLNKLGLPIKATGMDMDEVFNRMFYDKKIKKGKLVFILPKAIGQVVQLSIDDLELVKKVLGELG